VSCTKVTGKGNAVGASASCPRTSWSCLGLGWQGCGVVVSCLPCTKVTGKGTAVDTVARCQPSQACVFGLCVTCDVGIWCLACHRPSDSKQGCGFAVPAHTGTMVCYMKASAAWICTYMSSQAVEVGAEGWLECVSGGAFFLAGFVG
jgi:hypothetical protein